MNHIAINQAYLFLIFLLNGILIGIIFDIFRILRRSFDTPNFATYIEDVLFWLISAFSVIYCLFAFNNGEIRGYLFIGLFFGVALYMLVFSRTIVKLAVKIILFVKKIVGSILKIIIYPLKKFFGFLRKIVNIPYKAFSKLSFNLSNKIKKNHKLKLKLKNRKKLENKEGF